MKLKEFKLTERKRKGSPFTGLWTVVLKEMADHMGGIRMRLLVGLILLTALGSIYSSARAIRDAVGEDPFIILRLFTTSTDPLPSFVSFMGFLIPLAAITLGFDSINSEYNKRTLSRVLSQPIYRDALLLGKFLAALFTLTITLLSLWLIVIGVGLLLLGIPPSGEEVLRSLVFLVATLAYSGIWLIVAMLFSVIFRQPATSALASFAVWLLFAVFWSIITGLIAGLFGAGGEAGRSAAELTISRISPNTLYGEITLALLNPETRALGLVFFSQLQGALLGSPLPFLLSLLLILPHFTGLLAAVILFFALTYVIFQRQEIRA
ncbi:MAG: ABC transporter permease [Spirochaetes bacterium]|nr:MAG: ABC transporter permease [Spirochaetota bacterium]